MDACVQRDVEFQRREFQFARFIKLLHPLALQLGITKARLNENDRFVVQVLSGFLGHALLDEMGK